MSKNNENKLVPKLRFPEFQSIEGWKEKQLGEIGEFIGGGTPDTSVQEYWDGEIQWFTPTEIKEKNIKKSIRTITQKGLQNSSAKLLPKGALLITTRATIGDVGIANEECSTNQGFQSLVVTDTENNLFWYYWITHHKNELKRRSSGSTFPEIGKNEIIKITACSPKKIEQQKIASCLSSLDEVITAESQKLELLKDHKKGLLQNLFPTDSITNEQLRITDNTRNSITKEQLRITDNTRNSITNDQLRITDNTKTRNSKFVICNSAVPKFRFKEFEDSGEWVFEPFSEYIKLYRGSSPRPIQIYFTSDATGVNWIKIGDTKNANNFIINQVEERITPEGAEKSRKVNIGELILANSMSFGKTYQLAIEGYIYDGWFVLREFEKHFDKQFLLQLLNSDYLQKQYKKLSAGGIVQNISSEIVYATILPHTSKKEQQKIASCLTSIDDLIIAQNQKIEALQLHKKGLLQGLFPSITNYESENYDNNVIRNSKFLIEK